VREALPYAVGVALSPVPIAAILVLLTCRRAVRNGLSFLLGWTLTVAALVFVLYQLADGAGVSDSDPVWIAVVDLVFGAAFLLATFGVWRRRPERTVSWLAAVDDIGTGRSAALGVVLSGANPKVLALSLGAALALAQAEVGAAATAQAVVLFAAIGAIGVLVPLGIYVAAPGRSGSVLVRLRAWLERRETAVLVALGLVVGGLFVLDGLSRLG
jgi:hypothetical protein